MYIHSYSFLDYMYMYYMYVGFYLNANTHFVASLGRGGEEVYALVACKWKVYMCVGLVLYGKCTCV